MKPYSLATVGLCAALFSASACHTTGSVLGASIAELDKPFVILDLSFNT